jgi:Mn-dependent DtxR family transcriptional regulator
MTLTPREQQCFDLIIQYDNENSELPTHVWLADQMGIEHRQQVTEIIKKLVSKGALEPQKRHGLYRLPVNSG